MKHETRLKRKRKKELDDHVADLEAEKAKLEYLRDCRHLYDALNFYLASGVKLAPAETLDIRKALLYLSRGE